ncbi:MAG TPA: YbaB/EbfC family nucleoid-associated protein [Gemmataceae bacterium]|nr:YbaB/EbfC family nucleoid-associated protein [Gemmataceae bacterium]
MFEKLGQIASLMKNLPKMQEEMAKMQASLGKILVEGDAGGGMVKAKVNGHMEVVACTISEEAIKDRELLEDLTRAAINQAIQKAKQAVAEETSKMAGTLGFGLPPGFQMPT